MSGNIPAGASSSFTGAFSAQDSATVGDNSNHNLAEVGAHARLETVAGGPGNRAPLNAIQAMEASASGSDSGNAAVAGMLNNFSISDHGQPGGAVAAADGYGGGPPSPVRGQSGDTISLSNNRAERSQLLGAARPGGTGGAGGEGKAPPRESLPPAVGAGVDGPGDYVHEMPAGGGGDFGGDNFRAKVDMPSNKELESEAISELVKKLDANKAALVAEVQERLPNLPNIAFHGTSEVNARGIETSRTARGVNGGIYVATNLRPETDPSKYINDMGINANHSIGAGDTGKPAERIFVINPHYSVRPYSGEYGTEGSPSPYEYPFIGSNDNMAKDTVWFDRSNYDQFVLGSIDSTKYVQQSSEQLNPADGDVSGRGLIRQAFLNQNLAADAIAIAVQRESNPPGDAGI